MANAQKIAVLVSGGVDSSVCVHLLKEQGYEPDLYYLKISSGEDNCSWQDDIVMVEVIAKKYGLRLEVLDLNAEYWEYVVGYLLDSVKKGLTPNPDMMCNKFIKFGYFDTLRGKDYDLIATGHYATRIERNGRVYLGTAVDPVKDQTDFLAQMSRQQVERALFPLGRLMKHEVRAIAENAHLITAKRKDSQGICFLGKINYNEFLEKHLGTKEGPIVDIETGRVLGMHRGFWFHTIGQRKGLGLSGGPWFVVDKDCERNIVWVAGGSYTVEAQYGKVFRLKAFNHLAEERWAEGRHDITFKIRHTPEIAHGTIERVGEGEYRIVAREKQQGIAKGQFGVIYDETYTVCLGSGEISQKEE